MAVRTYMKKLMNWDCLITLKYLKVIRTNCKNILTRFFPGGKVHSSAGLMPGNSPLIFFLKPLLNKAVILSELFKRFLTLAVQFESQPQINENLKNNRHRFDNCAECVIQPGRQG